MLEHLATYRKWWYLLSIVVIIPGVISLIFNGLDLGIGEEGVPGDAEPLHLDLERGRRFQRRSRLGGQLQACPGPCGRTRLAHGIEDGPGVGANLRHGRAGEDRIERKVRAGATLARAN